jgi:hypothetical protein
MVKGSIGQVAWHSKSKLQFAMHSAPEEELLVDVELDEVVVLDDVVLLDEVVVLDEAVVLDDVVLLDEELVDAPPCPLLLLVDGAPP